MKPELNETPLPSIEPQANVAFRRGWNQLSRTHCRMMWAKGFRLKRKSLSIFHNLIDRLMKGGRPQDRLTQVQGLCLMHSELSEALEAIRAGNPPDEHLPDRCSLSVELADVVLRIMHMDHEYDLDVAGAILAKLDYNQCRPYKHGKSF